MTASNRDYSVYIWINGFGLGRLLNNSCFSYCLSIALTLSVPYLSCWLVPYWLLEGNSKIRLWAEQASLTVSEFWWKMKKVRGPFSLNWLLRWPDCVLYTFELCMCHRHHHKGERGRERKRERGRVVDLQPQKIKLTAKKLLPQNAEIIRRISNMLTKYWQS